MFSQKMLVAKRLLAKQALEFGGRRTKWKGMARPGWFEHPTFCFPPQADSIQLSYGSFAPESAAILHGLYQT